MRAKKEAFDSKRRDDVDVEAKVVTVSQPSQVSSGGGTSLRLQPRLAHQLGDLFSVLDSTRDLNPVTARTFQSLTHPAYFRGT